MRRLPDRREAGRRLAQRLQPYAQAPNLIVLGLARGGVPVAYEVAEALDAPLDVFIVRKLGVPGHEEVAMGAVASGGVWVVNTGLTTNLGIGPAVIRRVAEKELQELDRRDRVYRNGRPHPKLEGATVLLIDDGVATGASMAAAVEAVRRYEPATLIAAAPVMSHDAMVTLRRVADEVVTVLSPEPFGGVGRWYEDFAQTTDDEVRALLREAADRRVPDADPGGRVRLNPAAAIPDRAALVAIRAEAHRLIGAPTDFDPLLSRIGDARFVLLGEASHGTHDFYRVRAEITKRLIREKGFTAVAVEGDWPDAYRVNRYVRGRSSDSDAEAALSGFLRFPQWMWRNADVLDFVGWLRTYNDAHPDAAGVGIYGLDLYSLHASMAAVLDYLRLVDPEAAERAAERYACFDHAGGDPQRYGEAILLGLAPSCERAVLDQLVELRAAASEYARRDGRLAPDDVFFAEQNAKVVASAEGYYRAMFSGRVESWNLRDQHMAETLEALAGFLTRGTATSKIVVWAHNSHLGDARATEMGAHGELNLGQLVRTRAGRDAALVGFTTYGGTVTAASTWDGHVERKTVRPALPDSYEALFHAVGLGNFLLDLRTQGVAVAALAEPRLERAIGVIYRPETERLSHYFSAVLPRQFDAVLHYDQTRAVEPLERTPTWEAGEAELPETYPSAL